MPTRASQSLHFDSLAAYRQFDKDSLNVEWRAFSCVSPSGRHIGYVGRSTISSYAPLIHCHSPCIPLSLCNNVCRKHSQRQEMLWRNSRTKNRLSGKTIQFYFGIPLIHTQTHKRISVHNKANSSKVPLDHSDSPHRIPIYLISFIRARIIHILIIRNSFEYCDIFQHIKELFTFVARHRLGLLPLPTNRFLVCVGCRSLSIEIATNSSTKAWTNL